MSRINLLPWREDLKKIQNRIFFTTIGVTILCGALVVYCVHLIVAYRINVENINVDYLNQELLSINKDISQIQGLQENKENLLNRMRIIQALQEERTSIVKLLDILPKVVPDSVYLISIERKEPEATAYGSMGSSEQSIPNPAVSAATTQLIELEKSRRAKGLVSGNEKKSTVIKNEYHVQILGVAQTNSGISNFMKNLQSVDWISDIKYSEVSINKTGEGLNFKLEFSQKLQPEKQK
jgi:type IV pilus assembly protein PilN